MAVPVLPTAFSTIESFSYETRLQNCHTASDLRKRAVRGPHTDASLPVLAPDNLFSMGKQYLRAACSQQWPPSCQNRTVPAGVPSAVITSMNYSG
jgi:hypothetical protein